jgi:hypothetical protein
MAAPKKQKTTHVTAFILDGFVITTPNAGPLQAFPPVESVTYVDDPDPRKTFSLNWSILEFPQLAFVLSPPRWDHPLLQRLNHTYRTLPIRTAVSGWKLDHSLAEQWENLERALSFLSMEIISDTKVLFPLEFRSFPSPNSYGYLRTHRSERFARKCAIRARDAFAPLMAMCSLGLSYFHGELSSTPPNKDPIWVTNILKSGAIHPEWLHLFRDSPIADFTGRYPQVRVITEAMDCHHPVHI